MSFNQIFRKANLKLPLLLTLFFIVITNALFVSCWVVAENFDNKKDPSGDNFLKKTSPSGCELVSETLTNVVAVRGLVSKELVACSVYSKKEVEKYIRDTLNEQLPPEKLRHEEIALKALGLLPEEYNYKDGLISLYLSQLGALYDPRKKQFIMVDWLPSLLQAPVVAHELTHALQDQHFRLDKLIDPKIENGDLLLARLSLAEGDATALMYDFSFSGLLGGKKVADLAEVDGLVGQMQLSSRIISGLSGVPKFLQRLLLFPYSAGFKFVHFYLKRGGYAEIDKIFQDPPITTAQIIHPASYLKKERTGKKIELNLSGGAKIIYSDVLGEFVLREFLETFSIAEHVIDSIASKWQGDLMAIVQENQTNNLKIIWLVSYGDRESAKKFKDLFNLPSLGKKFSVTFGSDDHLVRISKEL
ncbi:MAG TPA: hypothetical protein PKD37_02895 [Oligoflexia bacterium]|nr:hypothetical protein [Oligoflexia bacterium]HMP26914.1 hypothetical protein [Oligoflexia bacterium]